MIAIQFTNTKKFMSLFLASETFDEFLLESAELHLANVYNIDGRIHKEFYGGDFDEKLMPYELSSWAQLRSTCFDLIKGKHTPLSFKFIMCASPDKKDEILSDENYMEVRDMVSSLVFRLSFKDGHVTLTSGAALSGFSLDKSYEKAWDDFIRKFLAKAGLDYEEYT